MVKIISYAFGGVNEFFKITVSCKRARYSFKIYYSIIGLYLPSRGGFK